MAYSFRFYGRSPSDWYEGGNLGHSWEVSFARVPSDDEKVALAERYERMLATGAARPSPSPWQWSAHVALLTAGERWSQASRSAFARVAAFLLEAHGIVPIAQVIFCGAREAGTGGWDAWTTATQPVPDPGPVYDPPLERPWGRPEDPALPVAGADPVFEAARAAVRDARRLRGATSAPTSSGLTFEPRPAGPLRDRTGPDLPAPEGRRWYALDEPGVVVLGREHDSDGDLHVLRDGGAVLACAGAWRRARFEDERTLLAQQGHTELHRIDLDTTSAVRVFKVDADLRQLAQLYDGRWLVRTLQSLLVLDLSGPEAVVVTRVRYAGDGSTELVRGGTVVFASRWGKQGQQVYGYASGKLKKLDTLKIDFVGPQEAEDGELVFRNREQAVTMHGLDEVYEAWATPLREKAARRRTRARRRSGG